METKKSFVGLEQAHAFFMAHSSQLSRAIEAMTPVVEGQKFARKNIRACFLGCGDIKLALHLVESIKTERSPSVTLVDTHQGWLDEAARKMAAHGVDDIAAHRSLEEACAPFDLIVAHHTMYYVPDLRQTLSVMRKLLDPNGILITALASRSNKLKQCAVDLFKLRGKTLPYWQEEDLEAALVANGFAWETLSVSSAISCADTTASRTALINFLMGTLDAPIQEALDLFTPYRDGVRLYVPMTDTIRTCRHV